MRHVPYGILTVLLVYFWPIGVAFAMWLVVGMLAVSQHEKLLRKNRRDAEFIKYSKNGLRILLFIEIPIVVAATAAILYYVSGGLWLE